MKYLPVVAGSIYLIGLISKFFHLPGNTWAMILGLVLFIVATVVSFVKPKGNRNVAWLLGGTSLWLTALLFAIKFWPFTVWIGVAAGVWSIVALTKLRRDQQPLGLAFRYLAAPLALYLVFGGMPSDQRYYTLSIALNQHVDEDYQSWDKYSLMLYYNNHHAEAIEASNKALDICEAAQDEDWLPLIASHQEAIRAQRDVTQWTPK